MKKLTKHIIAAASVLALSFCTYTGLRAYQFKECSSAIPLSQEQSESLQEYLKKNYPERYSILKNLPYKINKPQLDIYAESAIVVDVSNGNIIYQKDADRIIPPASMAKLFSMYIVDEEVSAGNLSYQQEIPLLPECWACNMPPRSSLMFLGKGQRVTLEELMLGLSICSGNDAAYALAYAVCGNMTDFVGRMNKVAEEIGLVNTHFVESSGYSEKNQTTAREMATFAAVYLKRHPESLKRFHSVMSFRYPKEHNLAPGDKLQSQDFSNGIPKRITMPVTQENTNPLLGKLEGCDGLKTGYIDESGYNLALTAVRDGTRFLSVTMKGPGNNQMQGQAGRVHDGTELMEWAFRTFADYQLGLKVHPYLVFSFNSKEKMISLVPAYSDSTATIPFVTGKNMTENLDEVKISVKLPDYCWGAVTQGAQYGSILITVGEYILDEIPLVADRNLKRGNILTAMSDKILSYLFMAKKV